MADNVLLPNGLTVEEEDRLVELLGKLRGPGMGTRVFDAYTKAGVTPAIEAVCFRFSPEGRTLEVYLIRRSLTDTVQPGEWHCPGSAPRKGEEFEHVFARLSNKEFGGKIVSWQFISPPVNHPHEPRGHMLSLVALCTIDESNPGLQGKWFPVDDLPKKTVACHRHGVIPVAAKAFLGQK